MGSNQTCSEAAVQCRCSCRQSQCGKYTTHREEQPPLATEVKQSFSGVTTKFLSHFLNTELEPVGLDHTASIYETELLAVRQQSFNVRCPRDRGKGAAYVDTLSGADNVGVADTFVSYSWGYSIGSVVGAIAEHCDCGGEVNAVYFWLCFLCMNQHRVRAARCAGCGPSSEELAQSFLERLQGIGSVLVVLTPWSSPRYFKRVWCIFELYTASVLGKPMTMAMPREDRAAVHSALFTGQGLDDLCGALDGLSIESACTLIPEDKTCIFELIEVSVGYAEVNRSVSKLLKTWIAEASELYLHKFLETCDQRDPSLSEFCCRTARLLQRVGLHHRAEAVLAACFGLSTPAGSFGHTGYADLLQTDATCKMVAKKYVAALSALDEACRIRKCTGTLESIDGAALLRFAGMLYFYTRPSVNAESHLEKAKVAFEQGLLILDRIGVGEHLERATLLACAGFVQLVLGNCNVAIRLCEEGKRLHFTLGTMASPECGYVLHALGACRAKFFDLDRALALCETAKVILADSSELETPFGYGVLELLAVVNFLKGDIAGACESFVKGLCISEELRDQAERGQPCWWLSAVFGSEIVGRVHVLAKCRVPSCPAYIDRVL